MAVPTFTAWTSRSNWLIDVSLEQNGRHALHVPLTMLLEKALSLFPKKEKMLKFIVQEERCCLDIFHLGLKKA